MTQLPPTQAELQLCDEIFTTNMRRYLRPGWLQCLVCGRLTMRSCLHSAQGCNLVNKLRCRRLASEAKEGE